MWGEHIGAHYWNRDILDVVARFVPRNVIACSLRSLDRALAKRFSGPEHKIIHLSEYCPPYFYAKHWGAPGATRELTRAQRTKLVSLTAASGIVENLEVALAASGCEVKGDALLAAGLAGQHDTFRRLLSVIDRPRISVLEEAAEAGNRACCELLLATSGVSWSRLAVHAALRNGHVDLAEWLLLVRPGSDGPSSDDYGSWLNAAALGCDLSTLQHLFQQWFGHQRPQLSERLMQFILREAAGSGLPDWRAKVEWLEGLGWPRDACACARAAGCPDGVERLTWLMERGYPVDGDAIYWTAKSGNVDALRLLLDAGLTLPKLVGAYAAESGHLAWLQAVCAAGFHPDSFWMYEGAAAGQLEVVSWLLSAIIGDMSIQEWFGEEPEYELQRAATSCNKELMAYLRQRGFAWSQEALEKAIQSGASEATLEWMLEDGCPMADDGEPYIIATIEGDDNLVRWLQRQGCRLSRGTQTFTRAAGHDWCCIDGLRRLLQLGCPVDWDAAVAEARKSPPVNDEVLRWLQAEAAARAPQRVSCN